MLVDREITEEKRRRSWQQAGHRGVEGEPLGYAWPWTSGAVSSMITKTALQGAGGHGRTEMQQPKAENGERSSYRLISGDSHVNEPGDLWTERVPVAMRDRAPRIQSFDEGDAWVIEGVKEPINFGMNA
jgi:hypothetical protein